VRGRHEPRPPVSGGRLAQLRCGPAEDLFEQAEGVLDVEAAQEACQHRSTSASLASTWATAGQSGFGTPRLGRCRMRPILTG
jgi:hypothetical protein